MGRQWKCKDEAEFATGRNDAGVFFSSRIFFSLNSLWTGKHCNGYWWSVNDEPNIYEFIITIIGLPKIEGEGWGQMTKLFSICSRNLKTVRWLSTCFIHPSKNYKYHQAPFCSGIGSTKIAAVLKLKLIIKQANKRSNLGMTHPGREELESGGK